MTDLDQVLEDIVQFYSEKGIHPSIYQSITDDGYFVSIKRNLSEHGFDCWEESQKYMMLSGENTIIPNPAITVQRVTQWDDAFATHIFEAAGEPWEIAVAKKALDKANALFFVAYDNGVPIGMTHCHVADGVCRVDYLLVATNCRNKGVGRALIHYFVEYCAKNHIENCYLWPDGETAERIYRGAGFRVVATKQAGRAAYRTNREVSMSGIQFKTYSHPYYQRVCDFLVALNREKKHINWNWARWEWMYAHPYCDREKLHTIGLWLDGDAVVGAAIYDLFPGEAFCGALDGYEYLLRSILEYAYGNLRDENGLGIAVWDDDVATQEQLEQMGYHKAEQTEPILCRDLNAPLDYKLPAGFNIREIRFPEDRLAYKKVIYLGFDHEGDEKEWESMLQSNAPMPPNLQEKLCLAVVDETGEFAAHCTCWYDERTDYAYVEPVCTIPKYRGMGLGKAVVLEALRRCNALGAKQAFVISDQEFYKKLGFVHHSTYIFFKKP